MICHRAFTHADQTRTDSSLDLQVPGHDLHISSDQGPRDGHTDVYLALRDVFDNIKRKLHELRS